MAKITEYSGIENAPTYDKVSLKTVLVKTEFSLPAPFNKKDKVAEKEILADIVRKLQHNHIFFARLNLGGVIRNTKSGAILTANGMVGWPDIIILFQGKMIGLEVKRLGGKVTTQQLGVLQEIQLNGGKAFIITNAISLYKVFTNEVSNYYLEGIPVL